MTKDLDLWIWPDSTNARKVVAALEAFGFGDLGLTAEDFQAPDVVTQPGYPPNRVDLLTTTTGIDFEQCWPSRMQVMLDGGASVPFIGVEELMANKQATGRPQDLVDIALLEQARE